MRVILLLWAAIGTCAAQVSLHQNSLTWGLPSTGDPPTGYHVWRATGVTLTAACASLPTPGSPVSGTAFATVAAPALTYIDTAVSPGQNSCYEVSAFNAGGESALSNTVSATTPSFPPGVPSTLSVVAK